MMYRPFPEVVGGAVLVAASGLDPTTRVSFKATPVPEKERTFSILEIHERQFHTSTYQPEATRLPVK